ncbi:MAG: hypothetical protein JEZ07_16305 [Phycisphaerae bacterium]|nr:hypothetical protein [Phycisphaerae bacterium]
MRMPEKRSKKLWWYYALCFNFVVFLGRWFDMLRAIGGCSQTVIGCGVACGNGFEFDFAGRAGN